MKRNILILLALCCCFCITAQKKEKNTDCIQGIWANIRNTDSSFVYIINKEKKSLIISLYIGTDYEYLDEYWVIFQDFLRPVDESDGIDSINIYSYADNGKYYTLIRPKDVKLNGWVSIYDYFDVLPYYECDENNMALLQTKLAEFYKIDKLPFFILKLLYNHGKTDKRDYITEYLDIRVMEITSSNCIMYTEPDKQVKIQLKKGDIITVLEGEKNLLKIEYDDEGKTGWIKRVDVK